TMAMPTVREPADTANRAPEVTQSGDLARTALSDTTAAHGATLADPMGSPGPGVLRGSGSPSADVMSRRMVVPGNLLRAEGAAQPAAEGATETDTGETEQEASPQSAHETKEPASHAVDEDAEPTEVTAAPQSWAEMPASKPSFRVLRIAAAALGVLAI